MRQCVAKSKRSGVQCRSWAMHGGTVCRMHGGSAPQTLAKARENIAMLRDKSAAVFSKQLDTGEVQPPTVMAAVRDFTKTLSEIDQREASITSGSVIDDWLEEKRGGA